MGQKQKYSADLLLEAVIKYSEAFGGQIKATELAQWARTNIEGLETVRDYHFTRDTQEIDPKTGKKKYYKKACAIRIEEINGARSISACASSNAILKTSNINEFLEMPLSAKRKAISEAQLIYQKLVTRANNLERENRALKLVNSRNETKISNLEQKIQSLGKDYLKLRKEFSQVSKNIDEYNCNEQLKKMGIIDGKFDAEEYSKSLNISIDDVFDINKQLSEYISFDEVEQLDSAESDPIERIAKRLMIKDNDKE